jgi:hypothetical protein
MEAYMKKQKECVLYDRLCIGCGECDVCDLDKNKKCDNCGKCIEEIEDYRTLNVDEFLKEKEDEEKYKKDQKKS